MSKPVNGSESETVRVTLSKQSIELLNRLASRGIHGRNAADVAARMIDRSLESFVELPKLRIEERSDES